MKKFVLLVLLFCFSVQFTAAQMPAVSANRSNVFDLSEFGVSVQPDARLVVVMLALEAAGWDSKNDSVFRRQAQADLKNLAPELRRRLRDFFARNNRGLEKATPSEQAARYVSLAYALSSAPDFYAPERTTELPGSLLEVLDFAPLVQEFYKKSGIAEKMPEYLQKYQAYGDNLRPQTAAMVRDVTGFLNTRPQTVYLERIKVQSQSAKNKKQALQKIETRERARRFVVVPDLLAVAGTVKLRVIGDDYFAAIAPDVNPLKSSELRRAYLQFLVDALVFKNAKEISVQKEAIRSVVDERAKAGGAPALTPDVYLTVARSLVVAAEARQTEAQKIAEATNEARRKIDAAKTTPEKLTVSENLKQTRAAIENETFAVLSEAHEDGAVLAFFFADQLRGLSSSGFDLATSLTDMINSFDAALEKARLKENETARKRALAELLARRQNPIEVAATVENAVSERNLELVKNLKDVEELTFLRDFDAAETQLKDLLAKNPGEPRVLYAMGRTAGLSATLAIDESVRDARLEKAAAHYRTALAASNSDTPRSLVSNAHVALGRIYEFYERNDLALKEFDAAIAIGNVKDGSYNEALAGKERLSKK
jgi:hypothetical protein